MICASLQWSGTQSPLDFPNVCERAPACTIGPPKSWNVTMKQENFLGKFPHGISLQKKNKKKKTTYVPVEFLDKVNPTVHILTVCRWEKKERLFGGWVFEFRQWSHTEGRVKRLNLSIDLQMLLTALCACCHSSLTQRRDALWQNVCSYCHRIPLYMSVGKPESAGQVLICVLEQAGEYINYPFSCRGG